MGIIKLEGIKEIRTFEVNDLDKLADSLATIYSIEHKETDFRDSSTDYYYSTEYYYKFRDRDTGELKGYMRYIRSGGVGTSYKCTFELENTVINLKSRYYNKDSLPKAFGRYSKCILKTFKM